MAEWLKALVLKTRDGNIRRFESCPFRHIRIRLWNTDSNLRCESCPFRHIRIRLWNTDSNLRCESCPFRQENEKYDIIY